MPVDKKLIEARGFQISRLYSGGPYRLAPVVDSYGEPINPMRAGFANIAKGNRELGEKAKYWYSHAKDPGFSDRLALIAISNTLEWAVDESMDWLSRNGYGREIDYRTGKIGPARYE